MGVDFTQLAATAKALVDANGRDVTINRLDQAPDNPDKPWNGPTDPGSNPDATATVKGCFVSTDERVLGGITIDDDLLKRTKEVCLVAPGTVSPPFDLMTANEIVDGTVHKKVTFVQRLKPATVTLLYFMGVAR